MKTGTFFCQRTDVFQPTMSHKDKIWGLGKASSVPQWTPISSTTAWTVPVTLAWREHGFIGNWHCIWEQTIRQICGKQTNSCTMCALYHRLVITRKHTLFKKLFSRETSLYERQGSGLKTNDVQMLFQR